MTVNTVTQVIHDTAVPYLGIPIGNNFMVAQLWETKKKQIEHRKHGRNSICPERLE
jgi:hypothetical protein